MSKQTNISISGTFITNAKRGSNLGCFKAFGRIMTIIDEPKQPRLLTEEEIRVKYSAKLPTLVLVPSDSNIYEKAYIALIILIVTMIIAAITLN